MEKIGEQTLLYDFYGEMLTPRQKSVYEAALFDDLSLTEIAQEQGISRQGVHDLIRRSNVTLAEYEAKLHLVERFLQAKKLAEELNGLISSNKLSCDEEVSRRIRQICTEMAGLF